MTKAARALGVTQPTLSAMLKKLESEVGAELLHRTGRGVELTEAGRVFLGHAEDAIRRADAGVAAVRELVGLEKGSIRVGGGATATTYLLPPIVSAVRKAHPGLRFYVREAGSNTVSAAVRTGELDMGIVTLPLSAVDAPDLLVIPLVEDELRLIVPARHRLAQPGAPKNFRWKDLDGESVVAFEAGTAVRILIDGRAASAGVTLKVVMELRSIESIKQMVKAGIGVGFVSRFALAEGEGLACRDGRLARGLALVRRRDRLPSPAGQTFERVLLDSLGRARPRSPRQK